jgi:hypothetical protein
MFFFQRERPSFTPLKEHTFLVASIMFLFLEGTRDGRDSSLTISLNVG